MNLERPIGQPILWKVVLATVLGSILLGGIAGFTTAKYVLRASMETREEGMTRAVTSDDQTIIDTVAQASPAVVSVVISVDAPVYERSVERVQPFGDQLPFYFEVPRLESVGTERRVVGGGTGFFVSSDGYILTNRHVVSVTDAYYTVVTATGEEYEAEVLDRDPVNDLAVLKVEGLNFPSLPLGESDEIKVGQRAIAIGYALSRFSNTVSVGVVSGLGRAIQASGGLSGQVEALTDLIQTDATINPGNSGGPLLDLSGRVIGVNVAVAQGSQSIGFAIPVDAVKPVIESVKQYGRIVRPQLGVRYIAITSELAKREELPAVYGAWIAGNAGEPGVLPGSPAERAGLLAGDIILELNGVQIDKDHPLGSLILEQHVGDTVFLKVLRDGEELTLSVELAEWQRE